MLRFLKGIREKLLLEGKIRTYFLYAIGEVFLVVVGILIAFQIDNWNEERLKRTQEFKVLTQIQSDLLSNNDEVYDLLTKLEFSRNSSDSLLKSFRDTERIKAFTFHASLIHRRFFFNVSSSGYALLRGSIGTTVTNDSLRNRIVDLYENDFVEIDKRQQMLSNHLDQNLNPKSNQLFEIKQQIEFTLEAFDENGLDLYEAINYSDIANNTEYINTIIILRRMFEIQISQLSDTKTNLESTLSMLDSEINRLRN
ncbi:MAG: hypothetical protein BalsKO_15300 [Balneolaceae bacterium]